MFGWLEVFKATLKSIPYARVQGDCISLVGSLSSASERAISRKVCAMIVCFFASIVPQADYQKTYLPFLKKAAGDANSELRHVISGELPNLFKIFLKNPGQEQFFPILMNLLNDTQQEVSSCAINSLELSLKYFENTDSFGKALDKIKKLLTTPNAEVIKITMNNIGELLLGITRKVLMKDREIFKMFQGLIMNEIPKNDEETSIQLARNLPAIILAYGPEIFAWEMFGIIDQLMSAENPVCILARATFANCFHEVVKLLGIDLSM